MKRKVLNETAILGYGHGDFINFYFQLLKGYLIKEIPYVQKDEEDGNTTTSPNLVRFFILGFLLFKSFNNKI